ncbi:MAG: DUF5040 domain-containing protein [Muribaculaceae bacterium]|nr:DUF5040 domain-containing protein [Muribaculaceae bacterium]
MNSSIDIDKNNHFLGYYYGVAEVLSLNFTPQPGMFFVNGETNSVWMWDALTRMWIDTNRVDSGMKGMLNNDKGNSPSDFVPAPQSGVNESYFYVAECEDCDVNTAAKPKDITFTNFKNGNSSVSVTVRKTSIVSLFWNGTYWETSVVPMNIDLDRLFKGILYAYSSGGKLKLYSDKEKSTEFRSNSIGGKLGSVWRVNGEAAGILISSYGTLSLITPKNMYLFEYSDIDGNKLESSSDDYKNGNGYWGKVTQCENLKPEERTKWNKAVTDLATETQTRENAITELTTRAFTKTIYTKNEADGWKLYKDENYTANLGYESKGNVFKVLGESVNGIAVSVGSNILVLSAKRSLFFGWDNSNNKYIFDKEYNYVTATDISAWNKAVTDLATETQTRVNAIAELTAKAFDATVYIDTANNANILYREYDSNTKTFSSELGFQTNGKVFKVYNSIFSGIGISIGGNILVLSAKRSLFFKWNNNKYIFDKEYNYVTATDISAWNKAVTDLAAVKGDITDLKNNPSSASTVEYATSVSVPKGGFVFADGASFLAGKNEVWLSSAMKELGLKYKSVAVGGQSIKDTAYRLCMDNEDYSESLEKMDVFLIDHVHNQDVFTLSRERSIEEYEEIIRNLNIDDNGKVSDYSISYAEAFDYVIKKHMANCYNLKDNADSKWHGVKSGKPVQMLLCTHWHDARTTYNESVRKLCAKWGIALCEMDINIGFAKTGTHPVAVYNGEPAQISLFYAQDGSKGYGLGALEDSDIDKQVTPHIYGLHQYLGEENHNFLTYKMASILMRCFVVSNVIEWSSSFNMNDYKTQGVYYINGVRLSSERDNLPILNAASGHSISGEFTVLDASLSEEEMCVTQYLKLSNRLGREGKEYIRTYNRFKDGREEWSLWRELKGTLNLNQISDEQLKSYTENGCYEGVIVNSTDVAYVSREYEEFNASNEVNELRTIPTACLFTMEVQNNYAVIEKFSEMVGDAVPHTIVQRVKFVAVNSNAVEVKRVCTDGIWGNWTKINQ